MLELWKTNGTVKMMCCSKAYEYRDEVMESMMMTKNEMTQTELMVMDEASIAILKMAGNDLMAHQQLEIIDTSSMLSVLWKYQKSMKSSYHLLRKCKCLRQALTIQIILTSQ